MKLLWQEKHFPEFANCLDQDTSSRPSLLCQLIFERRITVSDIFEPTMPTKSNPAEPTLVYEYANQEREYVFVVKGRPFPCLVSPHLPTPTSSLVDYDLVRDLGLKMTDLQCQKFSFAGHKLRILGKVSLTVQCINNGVSQ